MKSAPFQLDEGLFLETRRVLLPWDTSSEALETIGQPDVRRNRKQTSLYWNADAIFGGISVGISFDSSRPNRFWMLPYVPDGSGARSLYAEVLSSMTTHLGPPHKTMVDKDVMDNAYPRSEWNFNSVVLSIAIGERFMEYVALTTFKSS